MPLYSRCCCTTETLPACTPRTHCRIAPPSRGPTVATQCRPILATEGHDHKAPIRTSFDQRFSRNAGLLRNLSSYYHKDAPGLHLVRTAQGLLHAGKGLVTLSPYHSDRQLLSPLALAALLTVLVCGSESSATLCGENAHMIFYAAPALRPRMLITVDEAGDLVPVSVRVGTAVDTVAQAGKPKAITGALLRELKPPLVFFYCVRCCACWHRCRHRRASRQAQGDHRCELKRPSVFCFVCVAVRAGTAVDTVVQAGKPTAVTVALTVCPYLFFP